MYYFNDEIQNENCLLKKRTRCQQQFTSLAVFVVSVTEEREGDPRSHLNAV